LVLDLHHMATPIPSIVHESPQKSKVLQDEYFLPSITVLPHSLKLEPKGSTVLVPMFTTRDNFCPYLSILLIVIGFCSGNFPGYPTILLYAFVPNFSYISISYCLDFKALTVLLYCKQYIFKCIIL